MQDSKQDGDRETVPEENAEQPTEEGPERGHDEDKEEDEKGDALNEDYSRYDSDDLSNTHTSVAAGGGGRYTSEATPFHIQESGKLNCDICGLSWISVNVLLVHKRSHMGQNRDTGVTPGVKQNHSQALLYYRHGTSHRNSSRLQSALCVTQKSKTMLQQKVVKRPLLMIKCAAHDMTEHYLHRTV